MNEEPTKAENNPHKPAKRIEDIARLASAVEVDKNPENVSAADGKHSLSQDELDRPKPGHPVTTK